MKKISKKEFESYRIEKLGLVNRFILFSYATKLPFLRLICKFILSVDLPSRDLKGLRIAHPFNIIINPAANIGKNVTCFHGVTLGSKRFGHKAGAPTVCDDVIIFPNSVIIGKVRIGSGSVIGAGSVVTSDVPPNCVVAGNPARVISIIDNTCVEL